MLRNVCYIFENLAVLLFGCRGKESTSSELHLPFSMGITVSIMDGQGFKMGRIDQRFVVPLCLVQ